VKRVLVARETVISIWRFFPIIQSISVITDIKWEPLEEWGSNQTKIIQFNMKLPFKDVKILKIIPCLTLTERITLGSSLFWNVKINGSWLSQWKIRMKLSLPTIGKQWDKEFAIIIVNWIIFLWNISNTLEIISTNFRKLQADQPITYLHLINQDQCMEIHGMSLLKQLGKTSVLFHPKIN